MDEDEKPPVFIIHLVDRVWRISCGQSPLPTLIRYIEKQPQHHGTKSIEEELRQLLEIYEVEYDENYL